MQVDVALDVLGLSGEPTAAEVRRAYLRQVKAHPPERDAEGFRRVRAAYERLQAGYQAPVVAVPLPPPVVAESEPVAELELRPPAIEPEVAPPLPSFPPPVEEQMERLKRALATDDPLAAADSMVWLYRRPLLESAPVPAPILALQTILALMARGRFKRAGDLLEAMEHYLALNPQPGGFGNEVGARWKLVTEVMATSQLDSRLARALAGGLQTGQLFTATGAADAAFEEYGPELERHMREKAPTLWAQVAPLLTAPVREARDAPPPRSGFKIGSWPGGVVALIVFNLIRLLSASDHPSRPSVDYSVPAPRPEAAELAAPPEVPRNVRTAPPDAGAPPPEVASPPLDSPAPRLMGWGFIEESLRIGDCQTVREGWRPYLALSAGAHADRAAEASRKRRILEMCPELHELLEEPP